MSWSRALSFSVLTSARNEAERGEDLGCSIQGPVSRRVRYAHGPLKKILRKLGPAQAISQAATLVRELEDTPRYRALCTDGRRRRGRRPLREEVLFPDPRKTPPRLLHVRRIDLGVDLPVSSWSQLADFLAGKTWLPEVAELLEEGEAFDRDTPRLKLPPDSVLFVGHNTFVVSGQTARVMVDPYFRPSTDVDLPQYQPIHARDLPPIAAIVITHSHGDHFHLGSLLTLPRTTRIFVPWVERESLFSTDCALRLRQLGFTQVEALRWGESRQVGDLLVQALPFYGEQSTAEEPVYPGLFNEGNTWRIASTRQSCAFFADAGRDVRGDMKEVCRTLPPTDFLFCGIRGFRLRPIHYGFTTLDAFLVNAPVDALTRPVQLMADPKAALTYARLIGAREIIPCADGGAPWYWREGMGPRYPGYPGTPVEGASTLDENPDADPFPERLAEAAARMKGAQPAPRLLRPGDCFDGRSVHRRKPFAWPF